MEENFMEESVKKRLILAGLKELESHGPVDFSLRRVALSAEVSCAAPYRHFKSREHLIDSIIAYIKEQWLLFCHTIESAVPDLSARVRALCIAYMRFWLGKSELPRCFVPLGSCGCARLCRQAFRNSRLACRGARKGRGLRVQYENNASHLRVWKCIFDVARRALHGCKNT